MADKWIYNGVEFKSGDRVKIVRFEESFAPNAMGENIVWDNTWIEPCMDELIGSEGTIAWIENAGVWFFDIVGETTIDYMFPLSVLEKVE